MLTGILVLGFFAGLLAWRGSGARTQNRLLVFVQLTGVIGAIGLIMSAVYTEDQFAAHQFWSRVISGSLAVALFVTPFALHRAGHRLWPLVLASTLGYLSIIARLVLPDAHWLEWPSIGLLLVYLCVTALMTRQIARDLEPLHAGAGGKRPTATVA